MWRTLTRVGYRLIVRSVGETGMDSGAPVSSMEDSGVSEFSFSKSGGISPSGSQGSGCNSSNAGSIVSISSSGLFPSEPLLSVSGTMFELGNSQFLSWSACLFHFSPESFDYIRHRTWSVHNNGWDPIRSITKISG